MAYGSFNAGPGKAPDEDVVRTNQIGVPGGVATLVDVQKLYPLTRTTSLAGAVSGRALYEGTLNLEEANAWIAAQ